MRGEEDAEDEEWKGRGRGRGRRRNGSFQSQIYLTPLAVVRHAALACLPFLSPFTFLPKTKQTSFFFQSSIQVSSPESPLSRPSNGLIIIHNPFFLLPLLS